MKKDRIKKTVVICFLIATTFLYLSCSKDSPTSPTQGDTETTSIEATLPRVEFSGNNAILYASITNQNGKPIKGLKESNFKIEEITAKGDTFVITSFVVSVPSGAAGDLAVAVTMDYSGSMSTSDITSMELAIKSFINLKKDTDIMEIIKFGSNVDVVQTFTNNVQTLINAVDSSYSGGMTAFYKSCLQGIIDASAQSSSYIPSVIGFTDGINNVSPNNIDTVWTIARQHQIPVYTVGYGNGCDSVGLQQIADSTGGRYFFAPDTSGVANLYATIGGQLQNLYTLTWDVHAQSGTSVISRITTTYTSANGTYTTVAEKTFIAP